MLEQLPLDVARVIFELLGLHVTSVTGVSKFCLEQAWSAQTIAAIPAELFLKYRNWLRSLSTVEILLSSKPDIPTAPFSLFTLLPGGLFPVLEHVELSFLESESYQWVEGWLNWLGRLPNLKTISAPLSLWQDIPRCSTLTHLYGTDHKGPLLGASISTSHFPSIRVIKLSSPAGEYGGLVRLEWGPFRRLKHIEEVDLRLVSLPTRNDITEILVQLSRIPTLKRITLPRKTLSSLATLAESFFALPEAAQRLLFKSEIVFTNVPHPIPFLVAILRSTGFNGLAPLLSSPLLETSDFFACNPYEPSIFYTLIKDPRSNQFVQAMLDRVLAEGSLLAKYDSRALKREPEEQAIHLAVQYPNLLSRLLEAGANPNALDQYNNTPLKMLCLLSESQTTRREELIEPAEILLKAGADPNLPVGQTAPATVVVTNPAMLRLLVKYGADLSSTDFGFSHSNIYHMLAYEDIEYPLAKEIILIIASSNKPPAIDALNGSLESPLYIAVWQGCIGVTRALLDLGANVNVINKYGSTAMHGLFEYLDEYLAKELRDLYSLLMEHGIDTSVKNEEGLTAKQLLELKLAEESKGWSGELRHEVLAILAHAWPQ